jgi:hypothetical protein
LGQSNAAPSLARQVLLPIWHNITKKEVIQYSPSLADKLARSTARHTVEEIAAEIIEVVKSSMMLQRQIQNLRRTRDLLLPRLLSGQVEPQAAITKENLT